MSNTLNNAGALNYEATGDVNGTENNNTENNDTNKGGGKKNPFDWSILPGLITAASNGFSSVYGSVTGSGNTTTYAPTGGNQNTNNQNNNKQNNQQPQQGGGFYPYPNFQQPNFNLGGNTGDNRNSAQAPQKDNTMLIVGGFLGLLLVLGVVVILIKKK